MMKMDDIVREIEQLAKSQGSYGRLLADLFQLKDSDPDAYNKLAIEWEKEGFETTLDLVLFLEEGKHCKRKMWKIPVTWECYGVVEVEGDTIEDAIKEFHRVEDETEGFSLPEGEYVDGSFRLSDDDPKELKGIIAMMNKDKQED